MRNISKQCIQLIPGVQGLPSRYTGDGYADNIYRIYRDHHELEGGIINKTDIKPKTNFILGNKPDKYLTFYPDDELIVTFIDESIVNYAGKDININIIKHYDDSPHKDTKAHVSVSSNAVNYSYLGVLDEDTTKFDLSDINYTQHVSYIKFHFFGGEKGINISSMDHLIVYILHHMDIIQVYLSITTIIFYF